MGAAWPAEAGNLLVCARHGTGWGFGAAEFDGIYSLLPRRPSRNFAGRDLRFTLRMKTLSIWSVLAVLFGGLVWAIAADAGKAGTGALRHVVSFKFKDSATPEDIKKVTDAFGNLKTQIPGIVSYEWGTNVSPEKLNQGFTHCFILTFTSEKDRDAYLVHPAHKAFGQLLGPFLDKVLVIDFWANK